METRVRFAPSPTGFLHVGNIRVAIINFYTPKKLPQKLPKKMVVNFFYDLMTLTLRGLKMNIAR